MIARKDLDMLEMTISSTNLRLRKICYVLLESESLSLCISLGILYTLPLVNCDSHKTISFSFFGYIVERMVAKVIQVRKILHECTELIKHFLS